MMKFFFHPFYHEWVFLRKFSVVVSIVFLAAAAYMYSSRNYQLFSLFAPWDTKDAYSNLILKGEEARRDWLGLYRINVPIIVYHSVRPTDPLHSPLQKEFEVSPEIFENQLLFLRDNGFTVISFSALLDGLAKKNSLPEKPVILTFDDGWMNQYIYAFPLLKKYGMTGTFFVFTNAIGHPHFLSWDQIKEMDRVGMTIANHTKSHPFLFNITDDHLLYDEIITSKQILEEHLGKKVDFFAYPFGRYNAPSVVMVKKAGFSAARSTYAGAYHSRNDIFTLKSIQAPNDSNAFMRLLNR